VLGRDPDGLLVFGWCARCLEQTGCVVIEADAVPISVRRPSLRRRARHLHRRVRLAAGELRAIPWNSPAGRRLMLLGLTLALSFWSATLALLGAYRLLRPADGPPSPAGNGSAALLLAGSASMGLVSVLLLAWQARPARRGEVLLSVVTIASGSSCLLSLALWITRSIPGQWPTLAGSSLVTFGLCWSLGWRLRRARLRAGPAVSRRAE
jgi:hypothetical protein